MRILPALLLVLSFAARSYSQEESTMPDARRENPFAVLEFLHWNHEWNNFQYPGRPELEKAAKLLTEAGVGMVRIDFLWNDIEREPDKLDYAKYDMIVDVMSAHGIALLGLLDYTVEWDSPGGAWNVPSKNTANFVRYATRVVERYKGKVKHWELWNEPDSPVYWKDQDGLVSYCSLLKDVYQAVKKIAPHCVVTNGGLANGLSGVNRLYDQGAGKYFDVLNIHIFESPYDSQAIKRAQAYIQCCRKVMDRNGDAAKKIWVTEIGCPGVKKGVTVADWWQGKNPDESLQAEWVTKVYDALLKEPRVEKVFWAFFRDTNQHWKNGVDYFGLVRNDFSLKPAFDAYKEAHERWLKQR